MGSREDVLSPAVRQSLQEWLRINENTWSSKKQTSPYKQIKLINRFNVPLQLLKKSVRIASHISPPAVKSYIQRLSRRLEGLDSDVYMLKYAFPWAIEKVKERYSAYHKFTDQVYKRSEKKMLKINAKILMRKTC